MDTTKAVSTFSSLKIDEWLIKQIKNLGNSYLINTFPRSMSVLTFKCSFHEGVDKPTPVQINCIPAILEGRDCIGCDRTGSGKTFAFALPIVQTLSKDPYGIYALVLTPTRELAYQVQYFPYVCCSYTIIPNIL